MDAADSTFHTATRVDNHVFIGGYLAASDPRFIRRAGIQRIVKMFPDDPSYPGGFHRHPGVEYFVADAEDVPGYDMRRPAFEAVKFIQQGIQAGKKILVHCHAGISRSSTVVLLHLMVNRGYPLSTALARLKSLRPQVQPNVGFMEFLKATDAKMRALRAGNPTKEQSPSKGQPRSVVPRSLAVSISEPIATSADMHERGLDSRHRRRDGKMAPPRAPRILPEELSSVPWKGGGIHAGEWDKDQHGNFYAEEMSAAPSAWKWVG